ncbi:MAG TPA: amidohydrolase family protein, partial [Pyrinomonadaceae bacterium]|nr:amidohydrolase family protein [Pyrinomonadaceae bacterium]
MKLIKSYLCTFAVVLLLFCAGVYNAQVTAIKAGKLVDPDSGTTAINQVIIIEGTKIKSVGAGLPIPSGATVIDLSRFTVLPGLFDAHTHMCQTTPPDNRDLFTVDIHEPGTYRAILGVVNARAMLESGFTTIRDVGNNGNYADTSLRRA